MMNTPQLAAQFLGVALFDTARLAARSFIIGIPLDKHTTRRMSRGVKAIGVSHLLNLTFPPRMGLGPRLSSGSLVYDWAHKYPRFNLLNLKERKK